MDERDSTLRLTEAYSALAICGMRLCVKQDDDVFVVTATGKGVEFKSSHTDLPTAVVRLAQQVGVIPDAPESSPLTL